MSETSSAVDSKNKIPHPLVRDLRILTRIILVVIYYWTIGWLVRRRYQWLQKRGKSYYVDEKHKHGVWDWKNDEDIT